MRIAVRVGPTNAITNVMGPNAETEADAPFIFKVSDKCDATHPGEIVPPYMLAWPERMDSLNCGLVKFNASSSFA
jgi:hypothetical protein